MICPYARDAAAGEQARASSNRIRCPAVRRRGTEPCIFLPAVGWMTAPAGCGWSVNADEAAAVEASEAVAGGEGSSASRGDQIL